MVSVTTEPQWPPIYAMIPAAGVGKRMQSQQPKQYLTLRYKTILEHSLDRIVSLPFVSKVVVAINPLDQYFSQLTINPNIQVVHGGDERMDSVLAGLQALAKDCQAPQDAWVLVHDAARPNVCHQDIHQLVRRCLAQDCGGILAAPVRDTMKRGGRFIASNEPRENLWHALTPQFFPLQSLIDAMAAAIGAQQVITDEASAMQLQGAKVLLVEGRSDNLKITRPEDLALADFYLSGLNTRSD